MDPWGRPAAERLRWRTFPMLVFTALLVGIAAWFWRRRVRIHV
jgi:hypothetical protein